MQAQEVCAGQTYIMTVTVLLPPGFTTQCTMETGNNCTMWRREIKGFCIVGQSPLIVTRPGTMGMRVAVTVLV